MRPNAFIASIALFAGCAAAAAALLVQPLAAAEKPVEILTVRPQGGSGAAVLPQGSARPQSGVSTAQPARAARPPDPKRRDAKPAASKTQGTRTAVRAGGPGTATPEYPPFEKVEQLLGWINAYREAPEPQRLPVAVEAMSRLGLLRDMDGAGLYVGFTAGVLGSNPELAEELVTRLFPRPPEEQGLIIKAIAYSGLTDWRSLLEKFIERMPARRKQIEIQLFEKPETLETVALETGPAPIDALWGYYFATGSEQPLQRIVSALAWAGEKKDAEKLTIGSMAKWTLASNAMRDKALLDWLREAGRDKSKEIQVQLREVVVAAETFEVSKLRRDALAAIDDVKRRGPQAASGTWSTALNAAPTVIGLACVAASVAGQVALGIPCVVTGALSTAAAKHFGQP